MKNSRIFCFLFVPKNKVFGTSSVPGVSPMINCVPQVFKWFVTHLFKAILASLINETQGLFFLLKRLSL